MPAMDLTDLIGISPHSIFCCGGFFFLACQKRISTWWQSLALDCSDVSLKIGAHFGGRRRGIELLRSHVMLDWIEVMERKLEITNTVRSYLNPHKGLLEMLADQVMSSLTSAPAREQTQALPHQDDGDTMFISVPPQHCPCLTCNVMRNL